MDPSDEVEQCNECERLRMRIALLEASVKSCELETRSSRETVQRLMLDLDQERRKTANSAAALDSLKVEYEALLCGKRITESEKLTQFEQLEAGKRVIDAAKRESQCLEKQVQELERRLHFSQSEARAAHGRLNTFLNKVVKVLQKGATNTDNKTGLSLEEVCDKAISDVSTELQRVSTELREQTEQHRRSLQRTELSQNLVQDLTERLHRLESELQRAGEHRDGLQQDRQHYEEFFEKISEILKVETVALDLGFDLRLKLILSRAEQLMRQEDHALVQSKSLSYSLQRKVKSQKDQLESKALHIQLMRKKVLELEDERRSRSALAIQREDEKVENKRLQKKVERLQTELRAFRLSSTELKAQLSHSHELKLKVTEQKKKLDQLEQRKANVEKKPTNVTSDLEEKDQRSQEDQQELVLLRRSLEEDQQELVLLRRSLELLSDRERELSDFRTDVSHLLGLDPSDASPEDLLRRLDSSLCHCERRSWPKRTSQSPHCGPLSDSSTVRSQSLSDSGVVFK